MWRANNNSLKKRLMPAINGLILYHNSNTGHITLYITLFYLLLTLLFVHTIQIKVIFMILGCFIYIIEIINTIVEDVVDRISLVENPLSKQIKDTAAALVLLYISISYISLFIIICV